MLKKNVFKFSGIIIGALGGVMYWKYVGCSSGTCPLQSSWLIMTIYGALIGYLLVSTVREFMGSK